jgi:hypothetical protein
MLAYLKALASRLFARGFGPFLPPPGDPYAGVREPRRRPGGGRSSAVAVAEPDEPSSVRAHGGDRTRR